jgi:cysteine-rich repeat protein
LVCDPAHDRCVSPNQITVCAGRHDGDGCPFLPTVQGVCVGGACAPTGCGNAIVEPGEVCDDGNTKDGDGCSADCKSKETCGNGVLDRVKNEQCDCGMSGKLPGCNGPNSNAAGATCRPDCTFAHCGDGIADPGEQCDGADLKQQTCLSAGYYGSGTLACGPTCQLDPSGCERCGDGVVNGTEQCDGALVTTTCAELGFYGAGQPTCSQLCAWDTSGCGGHCGDGVRNGAEQCDGADLGSATGCTDLAFYAPGPIACTPACTFDTSMCAGSCGDGVVNGPEQCDGSSISTTCTALGFYTGGPPTCSPVCSWDSSSCSGRCGDGIVNGSEFCDGIPPANATCFDYGFDVGTLGCSSVCTPGLDDCDHLGWTVMRSDQSESFNKVWADRGDDVWVTGNALWHWDGAFWTSTPKPAVGIWGRSGTDLYVTTTQGVEHWDGTTWTVVLDAGGHTFNALWGSGANLFAGTIDSQLFHFDGTSWSAATMPGIITTALWGTSPTDVYAVVQRSLYHFDGTGWTSTGVTADAGWSVSPTDAYASSDLSGLFHFDGVSWTIVAPPSLVGTASAASGTGDADGFIVNGAALGRWDGYRWLYTTPLVSGQGLRSIWMVRPGLGFAVGGSLIARYRSGTWQPKVTGVGTILSVVSPREIVGVGGDFASTFDGTTWTTQPLALSPAAVWASSLTNAFVVGVPTGAQGALEHFDGTSWSNVNLPGSNGVLSAVWGSGPGDVYVGGASGELRHYNGSSWSKVTIPTSEVITSLWGTGPTNVYAGGSAGSAAILHYDGTNWTTMALPNAVIDAIVAGGTGPNDVWAMGDQVPWHYDGSSWKVFAAPFTTVGLVGPVGPSDVWFYTSSQESPLVHWDGARFEPVEIDVTNAYLTHVATSSGHTYFVNARNDLFDLARSCNCL